MTEKESTLEINKSPSAMRTRTFTCLPVFGQMNSSIALRIYWVEISFFPPLTSAAAAPEELPCALR